MSRFEVSVKVFRGFVPQKKNVYDVGLLKCKQVTSSLNLVPGDIIEI